MHMRNDADGGRGSLAIQLCFSPFNIYNLQSIVFCLDMYMTCSGWLICNVFDSHLQVMVDCVWTRVNLHDLTTPYAHVGRSYTYM